MIRQSRHSTPRRLRLVSILLLALGGVLLVGIAMLFVQVLPDPAPHFEQRKGALAEIEETFTGVVGESTLRELTLTSTSGLEVQLSVRVPRPLQGTHPLVLLLGGKRTGRDAVRLAPETRGVILAALSYPHVGAGSFDADGPALLFELRRIQRALLDTAPAVMLALDYLLAGPGVDVSSVELVGVSLGAFLVSIPGSLDTRVRRVWLVHGAGDPAAAFAQRLEIHIGFAPLRRLVAGLLATLLGSHHLAPEHWVGRISPRPLIIVNARGDEAFPPASIAALHGAAREPVEIIWTTGPHIMPGREEVVGQLARMVLERVRADHAARVRDGGQ